MPASVPRVTLEQRLVQLRASRAALEGQITEVEFWINACNQVDAETVEETEKPAEPVEE